MEWHLCLLFLCTNFLLAVNKFRFIFFNFQWVDSLITKVYLIASSFISVGENRQISRKEIRRTIVRVEKCRNKNFYPFEAALIAMTHHVLRLLSANLIWWIGHQSTTKRTHFGMLRTCLACNALLWSIIRGSSEWRVSICSRRHIDWLLIYPTV